MLSLIERARQVIPGGVNSGARAFIGLETDPLIIDRAEGASIQDIEGRRYFDFCMSFGPLIHGHNPPCVIEAVQEQLQKGITYALTTPIEEKLARKVTTLVPSIEQIRFTSSGTEATMSAVRLARGFTGREKFYKFTGGYHGCSELLLTAPTLPWHEQITLDDQTACIIIEPIQGNNGLNIPDPAWLQHLRDETARVGALLIFDEVITGFRIGLGGAQEYFNITPDLTTLGKILGGGFPAAAFGGSREIMQHLHPTGPVYHAGTLSGNPIAMAAGLATLNSLSPQTYTDLDAKASLLDSLPIKRLGSVFAWQVQDFPALFRHLLQNGIYIAPSSREVNFVSTAHRIEDLERLAFYDSIRSK